MREFKSFTDDLERLADWLVACRIDTVASGIDRHLLDTALRTPGIAGFHGLSGQCPAREECLGPQIRRARLPMAATIDELRAALGAFRPKDEICALRAVSRQRDMLLSYQARHVQHMQKTLAQMNVQLANVISDIVGETGQRSCAPLSRANGTGPTRPDEECAHPGERGGNCQSPCVATGVKSICLPCGRRWPCTTPTGSAWPNAISNSKPCYARCSQKRPVIRAESTPLAGPECPEIRCPGLSVRDVWRRSDPHQRHRRRLR